MKKNILYIFLGGLVLFGLIQLIPIDRSNPPVTQEPKWSSPEARALVKSQCFSCHSNETTWPWYSYIAPASWLIKSDVEEGRDRFNFSNWDQRPGHLDEMVRQINRGGMSPIQYSLFHPETHLTDQQKQSLIQALNSSIQ